MPKSLRRRARASLDRILDVVIPDACVLCRQTLTQRHPHLLCAYCWAALPRNINGCPHCALPQAKPGVCPRCATTPLTPGVCVAALKHEADARTLIHQFKYARNLRAGHTLAYLLLQALSLQYGDDDWPECLLPVPLSFRKQFARGFNQAGWLAHQVAGELGLPLLHGTIRRRHGPPQQSLNRRQRLRLAADTFTLHQPRHLALHPTFAASKAAGSNSRIPFRHVAIVDDVLTTGATSRILRSVLEAEGAQRVDIWTATRAVLQ